MEKQIQLLKKYGINNYTVENGKITINGGLNLRSLTTAPEGFLRGTTINGDLWLNSLTTVSECFLKDMDLNGGLYLRSLTRFPEDLFIDTIIKSKDLYLNAKMATKIIVNNIYKNSPNANVKFCC